MAIFFYLAIFYFLQAFLISPLDFSSTLYHFSIKLFAQAFYVDQGNKKIMTKSTPFKSKKIKNINLTTTLFNQDQNISHTHSLNYPLTLCNKKENKIINISQKGYRVKVGVGIYIFFLVKKGYRVI